MSFEKREKCICPKSNYSLLLVIFLLAANAFTLPAFSPGDLGASATSGASDPGVRGGPPAAGQPFAAGLSAGDRVFFNNIAAPAFAEVEAVSNGLGPRFNLDSCGGCHTFPALGGSSPPTGNPQVIRAPLMAPGNSIPPFLSLNGPVREVRMVNNPDGTPNGGVVT